MLLRAGLTVAPNVAPPVVILLEAVERGAPARQLLRETEKSVVAVALDVGYTNPSTSICG